MSKALKDGIYVNLPPADYFAQDRLGSTDLKVLHKHPADWWYSSRHNAHRVESEISPEMDFGSGLHALTLEGEEAYAEAVSISPFDDFRTKEARIWRDQMKAEGKIILTDDMDRRIRHMAALILNHPELGGPMQAGLSEVSVLFTDPATGTRLRARFDKLLPRFVVDLKSYGGNTRGIDLTQECLWLVKDRHMDIQRHMYSCARKAMAEFCAAGAVFGATDKEATWLRRVAEIEDFQWCWIFYRRRDDQKGHAPIVKPIYRSHRDATESSGQQKMEVALLNYQTFRKRFGFNVPWAIVEPGEEPLDHSFPVGLNDCPPPHTFQHEDKAA